MDGVMEGTAFITPMKLWNIGEGLNETQNAATVNTETSADVEHKQYLLATGQLDDAHTLPIAEAKAGLTLDVLITLRNKTLEAYNELIKMNI